MIKIYVYKNVKSEKVLKVTTNNQQSFHSTQDEVWEIFDYDDQKQFAYNMAGLKWALPEMSEFSSTSFRLIDDQLRNDEYYQQFVAEEFELLRMMRDHLLQQSDWTQMADCPISAEKKAEWAVYRQALRDLPNNTINPYIPFWPNKPT